jgi:shikimate kinase
MAGNRIIYIIGFMGSGKSTTGRKLASLLGWSFVDLDREIERNEGMKIPEIFEKKGEKYFRDIETETLIHLQNLSDTVVSTGGGTPCHSNNMDHMLASGITVYLHLTPLQLKNRLVHSNTVRPLIKDFDNESLLSFIEDKMAEREPWYNKADIIIEGFNTDISSLHSLIMSRMDIK